MVRKGSRVYIEGRIQTRSFDDKTGSRRHVVEVLADNMLLLDVRKGPDDNGYYEDSYDDELNIDIDFEKRLSNEPMPESSDIPF